MAQRRENPPTHGAVLAQNGAVYTVEEDASGEYYVLRLPNASRLDGVRVGPMWSTWDEAYRYALELAKGRSSLAARAAMALRAGAANAGRRLTNPAKTLSMLPKGATITLASKWEEDELDDDGTSVERNYLSVMIFDAKGDLLARVVAVGIPGIDYEILYAEAEHGWGPLAYDILMEKVTSLSPHSELGPGDASAEAKRVWAYYAEHRPDVQKSPHGLTFRKEPEILYHLARMPNVNYYDWEPMRQENPAGSRGHAGRDRLSRMAIQHPRAARHHDTPSDQWSRYESRCSVARSSRCSPRNRGSMQRTRDT